MEKVTIFLRTSLFSFGGPDAHVPPGVWVVVGQVVDRPEGGGLTVETHRLLDDRGRLLSRASLTIQLPWAKVDHVVVSA